MKLNRITARLFFEAEGFSKFVEGPKRHNSNPYELGTEVEVYYEDATRNIFHYDLGSSGEFNWLSNICPIRYHRKLVEGGPALPKTIDFTTEDLSTKDVDEDPINPSYYKVIPVEAYKKFPDGLEYMDICEYALAHLNGLSSHIVGQILKYNLRLGKKDDPLQEAKKSAWYAQRHVDYLEGKPLGPDIYKEKE